MDKFRGILLGAWLLAVLPLRAGPVEDLARIHLEALGGRERVAALTAVRATGHVVSAGKRVEFYMIAARPAKLRLEIDGGGRTMVQAYDGEEAPWEFDTGTWPPRYKPMSEHAARTFSADAEFDDPLVTGATRGYTLEWGGETKVEGKTYLRVLATRKLVETYALLIDADTYLIAMRVEQRAGVTGRATQIVTRFDDYRPVDGVLLAHRVTVAVDGRVTQQSIMESIEAKPKLTPETFTRPKSSVPSSAEK